MSKDIAAPKIAVGTDPKRPIAVTPAKPSGGR
jgi:hypothetical protein